LKVTLTELSSSWNKRMMNDPAEFVTGLRQYLRHRAVTETCDKLTTKLVTPGLSDLTWITHHHTEVGIDSRLKSHDSGQNLHTSQYKPWRIKTAIAFNNRQKALDFEAYMKSPSGRAFAKKTPLVFIVHIPASNFNLIPVSLFNDMLVS
jgi:hypothetical protein